MQYAYMTKYPLRFVLFLSPFSIRKINLPLTQRRHKVHQTFRYLRTRLHKVTFQKIQHLGLLTFPYVRICMFRESPSALFCIFSLKFQSNFFVFLSAYTQKQTQVYIHYIYVCVCVCVCVCARARACVQVQISCLIYSVIHNIFKKIKNYTSDTNAKIIVLTFHVSYLCCLICF